MNKLKTVIFWGAVWGILEATLGWFLHLVHFRGEALLLYPFGLLCMMMAVRQTGQTVTALKVAGVAALVKLVNLFMLPAVPVYYVTNPAVAIFFEGLVTWGFCVYMKKTSARWAVAIPMAVGMVFLSIVLFRGWQIGMDAFAAYNPSVHNPLDGAVMLQWGWRSLVEGGMLAGIVYLSRYLTPRAGFAQWTMRLAIPFLFLSLLLHVFL